MTLLARAWRVLTWRHWAWTVGVSTALCLSLPLQTAGTNFAWSLWKVYYGLPWFIGIGCAFLLALALVEARASPDAPRPLAYLAGALLATALSIATLGVFHESLFRAPTRVTHGKVEPLVPPHLEMAASRNNAMLGMAFDTTTYGVIGTMIYAFMRRSRQAEQALAQAELARATARGHLLASRLAAGRAAIDPGEVLARLDRVEKLYEEDTERAETLMDRLIEDLREAIPRLQERFQPSPDEGQGAAG
jgi:hypothetical protein